MSECKHENVQLWWRWYGRWIDFRPRLCNDEHDRLTCADCGFDLSLGPSDETDPRVAIEIRAAEIASSGVGRPSWNPAVAYAARCGFDDKQPAFAWSCGWDGLERAWEAGYLARCIVDHVEPIRDLIARSSIGAGLVDIKERGIDAHTADLERELDELPVEFGGNRR